MLDWSMSAPNVGPPLSASVERTWAMVAHIGVLVAAWFAMGFLCPLVIWLIYRYRSDYVRQHALESLNFQLSLLIYTAVAVILIGAVAALIVIILATVAAAGGNEYRYPLTIRFVK